MIIAQDEADQRRHNFIDTDHLLLAILSQKSQTDAQQALQNCGASFEALSDLVGQNPYETSSKRLELSRDSKRMVELAVDEMKKQEANQITPEHLLNALLQLETSAGVELLFQSRCDIKQLYAKMGVALPARVIRQHQQRTSSPTGYVSSMTENSGCLPGLFHRIKQLLTGER